MQSIYGISGKSGKVHALLGRILSSDIVIGYCHQRKHIASVSLSVLTDFTPAQRRLGARKRQLGARKWQVGPVNGELGPANGELRPFGRRTFGPFDDEFGVVASESEKPRRRT